MNESLNSKPIFCITSSGLDALPTREVIQICASALQNVTNVLAQHVIENDAALYNDKALAKLMKNYIDEAIYWHNIG